MLSVMTRLTIAMDDRLADAVRAAAGDNVSSWMAGLARREVVRLAVDAEIMHDRQDSGWHDRATEHAREIDATS
jgi:hypothetical protein